MPKTETNDERFDRLERVCSLQMEMLNLLATAATNHERVIEVLARAAGIELQAEPPAPRGTFN